MTTSGTKPIILNLAGDLSGELSEYFAEKGIQVVDARSDSQTLSWTHILVRDLDSFDEIGDMYNTLDNDIKLVSLSQPRDLKNFILNNGKLVVQESWLQGPFGAFLLDKFFQEFGGVGLSDNYPKFREHGSFNITNPFSTGEYLDHLVFNAFENGTSALSLKTYFDHILMYLTSLKNKGRVGFPVEVSYGAYGDVYGLQMHFFSENMQIEDVTNSLTSSITKTPEEYLLYVALQSTDFFDFTYLPEVSKVVITGLWSKSENVKTENMGMMFTHAVAANGMNLPVTEAPAPFILNEGAIEDLSSFVSPAGEEEIRIIPADHGGEAPEAVTVISGDAPEKEASTTVKGQKETPDKTVTKISGTREEKDDHKVTLSGTKAEKPGNMSVKSLGGEMPQAKGMFEFGDRSVPGNSSEAAGSKKSASLFKVSGPSKREEELEKKLNEALTQSDQLKSKLMTAMSELKTQKDTMARMKKISDEVVSAVQVAPDAPSRIDEIFEANKAAKGPTERELKMAEEFREMEKTSRRVQLEAAQKELRLAQELEKVQRLVSQKDTVIEKAKEAMTKALEKKDKDLLAMQSKLEQATKLMASGVASQGQTTIIKELEREVSNQNKLIEMYKNKVSTLAATVEAGKTGDSEKDELRKVQLTNDQLKTQAETFRKELTKLHDRASSDATQLLTLKQEKAKLTDALKKAEQNLRAAQATVTANQGETEMKRLQGQVQLLETYLKESNSKAKDLEMKLQTALAVSRNNTAAEDGQSKAKINHLENSVKKLTQDLVESRNQQAELKKETNKLRQEKTALQNTLDKTKKDLEKYEKKPASGKKAA